MKCTHYAKLYPQNGEHFVTMDSVTLFHRMYTDHQISIVEHRKPIDQFPTDVGDRVANDTKCYFNVRSKTVFKSPQSTNNQSEEIKQIKSKNGYVQKHR